MPPPYGPENQKLLHEMVKNMSLTPNNWTVYTIAIKGRAGKKKVTFVSNSMS